MTRSKRGFLIFAAVLLCLALVGSFLFIAALSAHHCTHDDDCSVCRTIDAYIHTLREGVNAPAAVLAAVTAVAAAGAAVCFGVRVCRGCTLVSMKTELRN